MIRGVAAAASALVLAAAGTRGAAQDAAPANALEALDRDAQSVMEKSSPAVVRVEADRCLRFRIVASNEESRRSTEEQMRNFAPRECVAAAGFLVDGEGLVLTTSAAAGGALSIRVSFPRGVVRAGTLVGEDPLSGAALVRVDPVEGVAPLRLAERELRAGGLTLFLAPQGDEPPALLLAFITSPRRAFGAYDAYLVSSLNLAPGHAGAPLLDARGEVVGMAVAPRCPSAARSSSFEGARPLGPVQRVSAGRNRMEWVVQQAAPADNAAQPATFVPARELRRIVADLRTRGSVLRGYLGVRLPPPSGEPFVLEVLPATPAARAGLVEGDRIVTVDGLRVEDANAFSGFIQRRAPGSEVRLLVRNPEGGERDVTAVLGELPAPPKGLFNGLGVRESEASAACRAALGGADFERCVVVLSVEAGSAAERAGLRVGDVLVTLDGRTVHTEANYVAAATETPVDAASVEVVVLRGPDKVTLTLK